MAPAAQRKRANLLDGKTWTRYSISVWSDIRKTTEETRLKHPALFPIQLAERVIECLSSTEDRVVLDPFCGVGSTLLAARKMGKTGIGIEISPEFVQVARRRLSQQALPEIEASWSLHQADAHRLLDYVRCESVDLVITSPPYWDILGRRRSADRQPTRDYGNQEGDLSSITDYEEFLEALAEIFRLVHVTMKPGKRMIVVVMDLRKGSRFYPFHADLARSLEGVGFEFEDLIIWDRRHEYNRMRPLGYPSVFRINKAHEYLLIFRKPGG